MLCNRVLEVTPEDLYFLELMQVQEKQKETNLEAVLLTLSENSARQQELIETQQELISFLQKSGLQIPTQKAEIITPKKTKPEKGTFGRPTEEQKQYPDYLHAFADGAGCNEEGGWGVALYLPGGEIIQRGAGDKKTTNNRMEITAAIECLKLIKELDLDLPAFVYSDSQYTINGITKWIHGWMKNDWKGGTIKNRELWEEFYRCTYMSDLPSVRFCWVKGHSGWAGNELADRIASRCVYKDFEPVVLKK